MAIIINWIILHDYIIILVNIIIYYNKIVLYHVINISISFDSMLLIILQTQQYIHFYMIIFHISEFQMEARMLFPGEQGFINSIYNFQLNKKSKIFKK